MKKSYRSTKKNNNILKFGGRNLSLNNWYVYHPNGRHMFTCGEKKAKWYLERDLAIQIDEYTIQFTFEPNGDGFFDNEDFGRSIRIARCVSTGVQHDLQRHHIVPYCYRSYFPYQYKSKNHHDVVLLNHDVHAEYEVEATKYKNELAIEYGIKSICDYNKAYTQLIREMGRIDTISISRLNSIFNGYGNISDKSIRNSLDYISDNYDIDKNILHEFNYYQLYRLYQIIDKEHKLKLKQFQVKHRKFYDHGYHLVNKLNTDDKIKNFVFKWRKHFIDTVKPEYMPDGWSINFRHRTNFD